MSARLRLGVLAVAAALAAGACGPRDNVDIGVKQASVDILYGDQGAKAPPPLAASPGAEIVPTFPPFVSPVALLETSSAAPRAVSPPPPPKACPDLDPFAVPDKPVTPYVLTPPRPGDYRFRQAGTVKTDDQAPVPVPAEIVRRVQNVVVDAPSAAEPVGSNFSYDVVESVNGTTTTTTYRVDNNTPSPGVKLATITRTEADGTPSVFDPTPDILLLAIPAGQEGAATTSRGADALHTTTMTLDRRTVQRDLVDACGTALQAWRVDVSNGETTNPVSGADITLSGTFEIAPQYGGLVLAETVHLAGNDGAHRIEQSSATTIDSITPVGAK